MCVCGVCVCVCVCVVQVVWSAAVGGDGERGIPLSGAGGRRCHRGSVSHQTYSAAATRLP